jgi:hypothetical protein
MEADMIDINDLEQGVLIEANDFDTGIRQLINDITVQYRDMDQTEIYKLACNVIGSLVTQNYVSVIRTRYECEQEDLYKRISCADLSEHELNLFLTRPDKWDEMEVFSNTAPIELRITEKGRDYLSAL